MTRILVAGGTGLAGRAVAAEALERGLDVRVLSRHQPARQSPAFVPGAEYVTADVVSTAGLQQAMDGVDVVVDALDAKTGKSRQTLSTGAHNLTSAAAHAGVRRAVLLSIVNVDQSRLGYYRVKTAQEQVYRGSSLETVIVRAAQFHNLVAMMVSVAGRAGLYLAARGVSFQPISVPDTARALVDAAVGPQLPDDGMISVGGPEVLPMEQLAHAVGYSRGGTGRVLTLPLPGSVGRYFQQGRNLVPGRAYGTETFAQWLVDSTG
ncbi:SDR family oxidoreductase [Arthrobacter castelli]|uniref:SDR family oxidoreductase n=1 Tax=Arthrobacter castelli TaxID=271431 RepID=UPI000416B10A|nr:NAD(P)H-binding protein [Arthrobacter castelli]